MSLMPGSSSCEGEEKACREAWGGDDKATPSEMVLAQEAGGADGHSSLAHAVGLLTAVSTKARASELIPLLSKFRAARMGALPSLRCTPAKAAAAEGGRDIFK